MIPTSNERLRELHDKMLDWICEHIKEDEDLFHALYNRIGFAQSELDPEIECRIYKHYNALPAREKLELRVKAEYAEFQSYWRTLTPDELVKDAPKIALVNAVREQLLDCVTDEQAEYFARFAEPLEAISGRIQDSDYAHESELVSLAVSNMYEAQDGGFSFESEEDSQMPFEQSM